MVCGDGSSSIIPRRASVTSLPYRLKALTVRWPVAHKLIFAMPRILTEREVERFIKLLRGRTDCWYACYPAKVEEKRQQVAMIGQHLKVVKRDTWDTKR